MGLSISQSLAIVLLSLLKVPALTLQQRVKPTKEFFLAKNWLNTDKQLWILGYNWFDHSKNLFSETHISNRLNNFAIIKWQKWWNKWKKFQQVYPKTRISFKLLVFIKNWTFFYKSSHGSALVPCLQPRMAWVWIPTRESSD